MVRNLSQRAGLPMPKVAVSPAEQSNAFATGRNPAPRRRLRDHGLLATVPRDEVEACWRTS